MGMIMGMIMSNKHVNTVYLLKELGLGMVLE